MADTTTSHMGGSSMHAPQRIDRRKSAKTTVCSIASLVIVSAVLAISGCRAGAEAGAAYSISKQPGLGASQEFMDRTGIVDPPTTSTPLITPSQNAPANADSGLANLGGYKSGDPFGSDVKDYSKMMDGGDRNVTDYSQMDGGTQ